MGRLRTFDKHSQETQERHENEATVQCFLSQLQFIFGMVISIQQSSGLLAENGPSQNLALGLAMVWCPVLMLCTVVDRNPAVPEATQRQLNFFLGLVREALLRDAGRYRRNHLAPTTPVHVTSFDSIVSGLRFKPAAFAIAETSTPTPASPTLENEASSWLESSECDFADIRLIESISSPALDDAKFFHQFAGQGRHLWHYGVAYPVIKGLQTDGLLDARRGWMYGSETRRKLIATKNWDAKDRLHS